MLAACWAAAMSAHAEVVVVLNSGEGTISLIDKATMVETKRIPIGKEPHHLMATPDDQFLIVANATSNNLVFLDPLTGEIKRRLDKISDPYQIGFSPDKKWFVAVSQNLLQGSRRKRGNHSVRSMNSIFPQLHKLPYPRYRWVLWKCYTSVRSSIKLVKFSSHSPVQASA